MVSLRMETAEFLVKNIKYLACVKAAWCFNKSKLHCNEQYHGDSHQRDISLDVCFNTFPYANSKVLKILLENVASLFHNHSP